MANRLPPLHALAAFEAVARHRSFSKAAEELCITHGAVSHRIKLLEHHLGATVIDRTPRLVTLTPAGKAYLHAVTEALAILNAAERGLPGQGRRRHLKINALPAFAGNWLIERLGDFRERHPDIDLEVDPLTYPLSQLDAMGVDIAIRYGPGSPPNLQGIKLQDIRLYPVCSPRYRPRGGPLREPSDLLGESLLRHNVDPWEPWFEAASVSGAIPAPVTTFGDARLVLDAAANGQGIALARDILTHRALRDGTLVRLFDIEVISPSAYFALVKPRSLRQAPVGTFVDWLLDCTRPQPASR